MIESMAVVASTGLALYVGHHVGDYWVQTHHQSMHKGDEGTDGALQCFLHVLSYLITQVVMLGLLDMATGWDANYWLIPALLVSGVTHYMADRRENGLMFKLIRRMPWKVGFLKLGVPRPLVVQCKATDQPGDFLEHLDNPSLGTGAWALDQSWHIFWGVFVPALILGAAA